MRDTDIRIHAVNVSLTDEPFRIPLKLSTGPITQSTYALIKISVQNRRGEMAEGIGGVFLSDLWVFPTIEVARNEKVQCMKEVVNRIKYRVLEVDDYMDPFQLDHLLLPELIKILLDLQVKLQFPIKIPLLLGLVCWSPFDAAIHDGWGKANKSSTYEMYNAECLNEDLGYYLGEGWRGRYPQQYLVPPCIKLGVQHVVGVTDPLTSAQSIGMDIPLDGLPVALDEWIAKDGVSRLKLKLKGQDVDWNKQFICDVYKVAVESLTRIGSKELLQLSLDPNEACPTPEPMVELLQSLKELAPEVYRSITYIEQPTPRDLSTYHFTLHALTKHKPVIIDESLEDLANLAYIDRLGWSGVALKTCKGQSHAILTYCWAKQKDLFITVQDLTNPGYALVQSANLASRLELSADVFEFNSRQYVPFSRVEERKQYPELFQVRNGQIRLAEVNHLGLY